MSIATLDLAPPPEAARSGRVTSAVRDVAVLTWRNLIHVVREPMQLSDVTVQPVLFTVLFVYVFGGGIPVPGGSYVDFALAGLLSMNLVTSSAGTAVGLASDLNTGMVDRFRALAMWRPAILVGRTLADLLSSAICVTIVVATGLVVGWRPSHEPLSVVAGIGVALLFSYALSWATACLGLVAKGPESAMSVGFVVIFPLAFISDALIPTTHMPTWVRYVAEWNPVSSVTAAVRQLFGNPNPTGSAWPLEHPITVALLWSLAIIAVAAPVAVTLFRRRTIE